MARIRAADRKGYVTIGVAFPPDLHRRLAIAAVEDGMAINVILRESAQEWLDRRDRKRQGRKGKGDMK